MQVQVSHLFISSKSAYDIYGYHKFSSSPHVIF